MSLSQTDYNLERQKQRNVVIKLYKSIYDSGAKYEAHRDQRKLIVLLPTFKLFFS